MFAEILEDSVKPDRAKTSIEVWNEKLSSSKQEGAVGRLEHHILESVRILGQREISSRKEQQYLKKMMTDISHQIKTPLASLQVFLSKSLHNSLMTRLLLIWCIKHKSNRSGYTVWSLDCLN